MQYLIEHIGCCINQICYLIDFLPQAFMTIKDIQYN